jgi:hypothetical protein
MYVQKCKLQLFSFHKSCKNHKIKDLKKIKCIFPRLQNCFSPIENTGFTYEDRRVFLGIILNQNVPLKNSNWIKSSGSTSLVL